MALQPAFYAPANTESNVTGDRTDYTVLFAATEVFDRNADYSTPDFTAPVTGLYRFTINLEITALSDSYTEGTLAVVASNRSLVYQFDPEFITSAGSTSGTVNLSFLVDMDANVDTIHVQIKIGNSDPINDIVATTSFWCGELVI